MKYIVIFNKKDCLSSILLTNILQENLSINNIDHEIILGLFSSKLCDSIFYRPSSVKDKFNLNSIKDVWSFLKTIYSTKSKKTIINLSSKIYIRFFLILSNRNTLRITIVPAVKSIQQDAGKILNIISKRNGLKFNHFNLQPREYISEKNIQKSTEYINWILTSSGLKKIEQTRYLYVLLDSNKLQGRTNILQILSTFLNSIANCIVIFSFYNFNRISVDDFINEINDYLDGKALTNQFVKCDENIKISLVRQSKILITDSEQYHYFSVKNDKASYLLRQMNNDADEKSETLKLKHSLLHIELK